MALIISTWIWGNKYNPEYVAKLQRGVARHMREPYEFKVFSPELRYAALLEQPGCLIRLRMFSPEWQENQGIKPGDKLVCLDLDIVVTGSLDRLFKRPETFVILSGANSTNPCPFNGSLMMLTAGCHADVWTDFSLEKTRRIKFADYPDDQEWLWNKLPDAGTWKCGPNSCGVYAFCKPGWPRDNNLPSDARLVAFPGWRDPSKFLAIPWIVQNWT